MTPSLTKPRVLHVSAWRENLGGIQSVLSSHRSIDAAAGYDPFFLSLFDRENTWSDEATTIAVDGWTPVGAIKRRFQGAANTRQPDLAIYHDGWGLTWFAPIDGAGKRILYLHTERPHADKLLRQQVPLVDAVVAVSDSLIEHLMRIFPQYPVERCMVLPLKVNPPESALLQERTFSSGPLRLGYAGRIEQGHKRLDRLPALLSALDQRGIPWTLDILGEGSFLPRLRELIAHDERVTFSGWQRGDAYWSRISTLDVMIFTSDYEGFSLAALEAMSIGIPVVYPNFSPAAGALLGPLSPTGLYPVGDMVAAADQLAMINQMTVEKRKDLREACLQQTVKHRDGSYERLYAELVQRVLTLPAIARLGPVRIAENLVPLGLYTRMFPGNF